MKAIQILIDTHWSSAGWKLDPRTTPPADFEYAKSKGTMFDPLHLTHDEMVQRIIQVRSKLTPQHVGDAFLASLTTRHLEFRCALASYR